MTTRTWPRLLAGLIGAVMGLNVVCALLHWATICSSLREKFHLDHPLGRVGLVVGYFAACLGFGRLWLPHMLDPAKRPVRAATDYLNGTANSFM